MLIGCEDHHGLLKNEPDAVVVIIATPLKVDSPAMKEKDVISLL